MENIINAVVIRHRNAFSEALSELLLMTSLERSKTEGSEEKFEHKAAKETKAYGGLGFRDDYSAGAFGVSSNRPSSPRIGVNIAAPLEPLRSVLNRRKRRKFEQKAAKATKAHGGLGFRDDYSAGAFGVSSYRPRPRESTPILLRRLNRFDPCSTEGSEENFEHKAAKATKAYGGLSFRDTYSVGPSASPPIVLVLEV